MKKSELKELIRRELQTINEHDRQKILKYLVKKGSNKKDAEELLDKHYDYLEKKYRNAPIAKKAEVLVTLGGTASEGTITEKQEADEHMIRAIGDLTQVNDHSQARYMAARYTGNEKLKSIYASIRSIQETLGSLPKELSQFRSRMDKTLKKELQKKVSNWEDVWGAL